MSQQHPIDDLFRRKLEEHSSLPPMHLWDAIDQKRNWKHRLWLRLSRNRLTIGVLLLGMVASLWLWPQLQPIPTIESFPIPITAPIQPAPISATAVPALSTPTEVEIVQEQTELPTAQSTTRLASSNTPPPIAPPVPRLNANWSAKGTAPIIAQVPALAPKEKETSLPAPRDYFVALPTIESAFQANDPQLNLDYLAKTDCAEFVDHSIRLSLDLMAGPSFALREFTPENSEFSPYANLREETESSRFAYSATARFSATTSWGLAVRTGLSYTQINERFKYLNEQEERITITNIKDMDGNVIGTDTIVELGTRQVERTNHYRMLDIPVLLGYELSTGKFAFSVNGGILFNVLFDQDGQLLDPIDQQPTLIGTGADQIQPFRKRLALGYYGGLSMAYELKDDLSLLIEPHFRIDPQPVTRRDFVVSQRYFTTGLSIGLRKDL